MSVGDVEELLTDETRAPAVTIYLPTHLDASPPNQSEDEIRAKNLLNKAVSIMDTRDDSRNYKKEFTESFEPLLASPNKFEHQTAGLLVCSRPGRFAIYHLPLDSEEYVAVSDQYHLAPVFGIINDLREYYILILAQQYPILYQGDFYGVYKSDIKLPSSLKVALNIDETGKENEQQRSAYGGVRGTYGFNGRGGDKNPAENERMRFWRMIDQALMKHGDRKRPLIIAGIASEISEYLAHSHYPQILKHHIEGNFSGSNPIDLYRLAMNVIRHELLNPYHDRVIEEYKGLNGQAPHLTADNFAAIADAAEKGRVDKLLVSSIRYTADTVRDNYKPVPVITFPPVESSQAVNDIARIVWNCGGSIINIESSHMPKKGALMVATMRY